jgi:hypothetical protein
MQVFIGEVLFPKTLIKFGIIIILVGTQKHFFQKYTSSGIIAHVFVLSQPE